MRRPQHTGFQVSDNFNYAVINQDFSFTNFERVSPSHVYISEQYPHKKTGAISVSAFVKHINLYTFKKMSQRGIYTSDTAIFANNLYQEAKHIYYKNMNYTLKDFMDGTSEYRFVYGEFRIEKGNSSSRYLLIVQDKIKIHINATQILELMNNFFSVYKSDLKKYVNRPDCHVVFGGFIRKVPYKSAYYYEYLDGTTLLTSVFGVFSESFREVEMYNHVVGYILKNNLSKNIQFFKPDFYDISPYNNHYMADGVIKRVSDNTYWYVEVFGMNNQEYQLKKYWKIEVLKNQLIAWTPQKEKLPDLSKYF